LIGLDWIGLEQIGLNWIGLESDEVALSYGATLNASVMTWLEWRGAAQLGVARLSRDGYRKAFKYFACEESETDVTRCTAKSSKAKSREATRSKVKRSEVKRSSTSPWPYVPLSGFHAMGFSIQFSSVHFDEIQFQSSQNKTGQFSLLSESCKFHCRAMHARAVQFY